MGVLKGSVLDHFLLLYCNYQQVIYSDHTSMLSLENNLNYLSTTAIRLAQTDDLDLDWFSANELQSGKSTEHIVESVREAGYSISGTIRNLFR